MTAGDRTDPYLGFRFRVELDSLIVGAFAQVSGLSIEIDTEEVPEGGVNHYTRTVPTGTSHSNVTLERGLTDSSELWDWMQATVHGRVDRRNGRIILLDAAGDETWSWSFRGAYPVSWEGPDLDAAGSEVAIERLELAHLGFGGGP